MRQLNVQPQTFVTVTDSSEEQVFELRLTSSSSAERSRNCSVVSELWDFDVVRPPGEVGACGASAGDPKSRFATGFETVTTV